VVDTQQWLIQVSPFSKKDIFWITAEHSTARMGKVTVIIDEGTFEISMLSLWQGGDAPALLSVSSGHVRLSAAASIVQSFIEALNCTAIKG
jgi:hypothetical protein